MPEAQAARASVVVAYCALRCKQASGGTHTGWQLSGWWTWREEASVLSKLQPPAETRPCQPKRTAKRNAHTVKAIPGRRAGGGLSAWVGLWQAG